MKSPFVTCITLFVALLYCGAEFLAAPPEAIQSNDEEWAARSGAVSLGDGDYRLVTRDGAKLVLRHAFQGKATYWPIDLRETEPAFGPSRQSWGDDIREIALSRWSRNHLVAVVRLKEMNGSTFWCLTIANVKDTTGKQDRLTAPAGVIANGSEDDCVLALSGKSTITAVMGKWSDTQPGAVESGHIFFSGCPTMMGGVAMGGRTGIFKTEYAPIPVDLIDEKKNDK